MKKGIGEAEEEKIEDKVAEPDVGYWRPVKQPAGFGARRRASDDDEEGGGGRVRRTTCLAKERKQNGESNVRLWGGRRGRREEKEQWEVTERERFGFEGWGVWGPAGV